MINKWYYKEIEEGKYVLLFLYKQKDCDYFKGFEASEYNRIKGIEVSARLVNRDYVLCDIIEIKGKRFSVFDSKNHYLFEVNLK